MRAKLPLVILLCLAMITGCSRSPRSSTITYVASIAPLEMVLQELTLGRAEVKSLLPVGASPHTFEPTPDVVFEASKARALFWVSPGLDQWATSTPLDKKVETLPLIPKEDLLANLEKEEEAPYDPHFWTDPLIVKAMIPALVQELVKIDPEGEAIYKRNAVRFDKQLDQLHIRLAKLLEPVSGRSVLLIHPSFQYLCRRYRLKIAAIIEPFPGKEPTASELNEVLKIVVRSKVKAIFTEPQISNRPAQSIAESAHIKVGTLDPIGGSANVRTYEALILANAKELRNML
jgi:ABC-type Zn uptake system ZnuABC Zn-binding protein ZnuA